MSVDTTIRKIIEVDASGGAVTVTYAPSLATGWGVVVAKVDTSANAVNISPDGVTIVDVIATPASGDQIDSRTVWSNGSQLFSCVGGPSGVNTIVTTSTNYTVS